MPGVLVLEQRIQRIHLGLLVFRTGGWYRRDLGAVGFDGAFMRQERLEQAAAQGLVEANGSQLIFGPLP